MDSWTRGDEGVAGGAKAQSSTSISWAKWAAGAAMDSPIMTEGLTNFDAEAKVLLCFLAFKLVGVELESCFVSFPFYFVKMVGLRLTIKSNLSLVVGEAVLNSIKPLQVVKWTPRAVSKAGQHDFFLACLSEEHTEGIGVNMIFLPKTERI